MPSVALSALVGRLGIRRSVASAAIALILLGIAVAVLSNVLREISLRDIQDAFRSIAPARIALAVTLTVTSYAALAGRDALALRTIRQPLSWRMVALGSFIGSAFGNMLGWALLTGGALRHRIYRRTGIGSADVARLMAIISGGFWLGLAALAGIALILQAGDASAAGATAAARVLGGAVLIGIVVLAILCGRASNRLVIARLRLPLPDTGQMIAQIGLAASDLLAAGGALFVLLPDTAPALLPTFFVAYALAIVGGLVSHVPGGIGVFETIVISTVPTDKPVLIAALLAYRVIYYLAPLTIAAALLARHEARRGDGRTLRRLRAAIFALAPLLLSTATFAGGAILLLSGALPALPERFEVLRDVLPLPFVDASHLAASLAGTGLLLIAPGLYRRLDGAALLARLLLVAGAIFSLLKGLDYEEALACLGVAGALHWTRSAFYRRTELVGRPLSPAWLVSVLLVVGLSVVAGLLAYGPIRYDNVLWWQFAWEGNAPRFLRASLGTCVVLAAAAVWRLFAPARVAPAAPLTEADLQHFIALADRTEANLALIGDKRLLFSKGGDAALMYQIRRSSWVVMGDPVGAREAWPDLFWRLRAMADAAQGRLLLYQIGPAMLEIAVGLGLQIIKYGEEAILDLPTFSLAGSRMRSLRQTDRRIARDGASFEVIPAADVAAILPRLQQVSDAWLNAKGQREKGFSLGRFDPDYLARCDCAAVRVNGEIVAFANLWRTPDREELSVDLMRHDRSAPPGTMDFLFTRLAAWGAAQGYRRFSLGVAPLSGIDGRRLAPAWARIAAMLFRHGERLYGFRGLRAYKEKFDPIWEPCFVAGPGGAGLLLSLRDLNLLINRPRLTAGRRR